MLKTPILYNSSTFLRQFFVQTNNRIRNPDPQSNTTGFLHSTVSQTYAVSWGPSPPPLGAKEKGEGGPHCSPR